MKHGDARQALSRKLFDNKLGLVVVTNAHIKNMAIKRRTPQFRAGERAEEREPRVGSQRNRRRRAWRADVAE